MSFFSGIGPKPGRIQVLVLILVTLFSTTAMAETIRLTIDEAVKMAMDQSIDLKKSAIDLATTQYSANNLWSEIFPSFSLSSGLTVFSTPLLTDPGFTYSNDTLSYNLNFGVSLTLNPSIASSMKRIELAYRTQLLKYDDARNQLEIQVIKYFLNLNTLKENISLMEQNLRISEQQYARNQIAFKNGLISELDLMNSNLSTETARYNLTTAQGTYQNALEAFLAILGIETGTDIIFSGTVEIAPINYDPEQLILEYLPKRPDIINQRQTIENLILSQNITTLGSRSPSLDLGTQWRGGSPSNNKQGLGAPFSDNVAGTITLRVPIDSWIPGTKSNQTVRSANAEVEKARLDLQNTETQAKAQIRSLIINLRNTWSSIEIARMRVELAQRTVDNTEKSFQNGGVEFQELENARRDLSDAQQRLLQGEYNYQSMLLDLAAALNVDWRTMTNQQNNELSRYSADDGSGSTILRG